MAVWLAGFNPSVGILLVWTCAIRYILSSLSSFNPSVGILLVWTGTSLSLLAHTYPFQSLGRDSVGLDFTSASCAWRGKGASRQFQSLGRDSVGLDSSPITTSNSRGCFNPSVGILLVWTSDFMPQFKQREKFQSLGRDSVGLDQVPVVVESQPRTFQSLGRDSVGLDFIRM